MIAQICKGSFTCQHREDGILDIVIAGELLPAFTCQIAREIRQAGPVRGLLLDVRDCMPLSIIRLSACIDTLSRLALPLAVVFLWVYQQDLAILLHPALLHNRRLSYFTNTADAVLYLRGS